MSRNRLYGKSAILKLPAVPVFDDFIERNWGKVFDSVEREIAGAKQINARVDGCAIVELSLTLFNFR
jgi:hypothetical protein